jgi:hypothetical protein
MRHVCPCFDGRKGRVVWKSTIWVICRQLSTFFRMPARTLYAIKDVGIPIPTVHCSIDRCSESSQKVLTGRRLQYGQGVIGVDFVGKRRSRVAEWRLIERVLLPMQLIPEIRGHKMGAGNVMTRRIWVVVVKVQRLQSVLGQERRVVGRISARLILNMMVVRRERVVCCFRGLWGRYLSDWLASCSEPGDEYGSMYGKRLACRGRLGRRLETF